MSSESLTYPVFFNFKSNTDVPESTSLISAAAVFYRTISNSNIEIYVPKGPTIPLQDIFISPDVFLPVNTFNSTKTNIAVIFPNNKDAQILQNYKCLHDITIQFKMTRMDGNNYINQREIRAVLVNNSNVVYDETLSANNQPDTSEHDIIVIRGYINHTANDIIKIKLNVVQDVSRYGDSDTEITIFKIIWNIL